MARIGIDIDSTLHHYWDVFARIVEERCGVSLPYEQQRDWHITQLEREQLIACIAESHADHHILSAEPYPGAVETVRAWYEDGHWIHITSHRAAEARDATAEWLEAIGLPFHDLHCSYDKVTRCVELGIDVLIDDSPVNLTRAGEAGILGATLIHPWNEELVANGGGIVAGEDWFELRERLGPVLDGDRPRSAAG